MSRSTCLWAGDVGQDAVIRFSDNRLYIFQSLERVKENSSDGAEVVFAYDLLTGELYREYLAIPENYRNIFPQVDFGVNGGFVQIYGFGKTYTLPLGLRKSVAWLNFSGEQTEKAIHNSVYTVVAEQEGQAVGMGRLIGDGMYFIMADIVVHPAYQGKGIGSKIVDMIIEYVDKETPPGGRSSIQLVAEKGKEPLYETGGFKLIPHEFCGSGMRKIIRKPIC